MTLDICGALVQKGNLLTKNNVYFYSATLSNFLEFGKKKRK